MLKFEFIECSFLTRNNILQEHQNFPCLLSFGTAIPVRKLARAIYAFRKYQGTAAGNRQTHGTAAGNRQTHGTAAGNRQTHGTAAGNRQTHGAQHTVVK
jgi:hypothetical protein